MVGEILVAETESDCDEIEGEENCEDLPMPTIESGMGLPPSTDEEPEHSVIRGRAPEDQECSESSVTTVPMGHISAFKLELLTEARSRFAKFSGVDVSEVDEHRLSRTSLGVEVWACAHVMDADLSGSSRGESSC